MRRWLRRAAWFFACIGVVLPLGAGVAWQRGLSASFGRWCATYRVGVLAIGVCDSPVTASWAPPAPLPSWQMMGPAGARVMVAPRSSWRPSTALATVSIGPSGAAATTYTLNVYWVPLWGVPIATLFLGALLWRLSKTSKGPWACAACGYDLRGLAGPSCPECGTLRPVDA